MIIKPIMATRLRTDHTTYATIIYFNGNSSVPYGSYVEGDQIWTAPADGDQVFRGDTWLHVTKINAESADGWMAIVHKGVRISTLIDDGGVVTPPPPTTTEEVVIKAIKKAEITVDIDGKIWVVTCLPVSAALQ